MHEQTQDLRSNLQVALSSDEAAANLVLAWRASADKYRVLRVQMTDDLAAHFLELVRNAAEDLLRNRRRVDYDPDWPLKEDEYFAIPNDPPPGGNLFVELADYLNAPWFTRKNMSKATLYVVAVWTPQGTAFFGRRSAGLAVLSRRSRTLRLAWDGEVMDELDESVLTFAPDFDWVVFDGVDGTMHVLDTKGFHGVFRDLDALKKAVDDNVLAIRSKIDIENADELAERCRRVVPMASKLQRVVTDGLLDRTPEELRKYGAERGIDVTWNGDTMVYENTIEKQWNILKLLDEDHTVGPVSGRTFDSPAKRQIA